MVCINNLSFEFIAHNESFVEQMYAKWDEFCRDIIEPIVDEVLSDFDGKTIERSVERLDLNIGSIREEHFFEDFSIRFREELVRVARMEFVAEAGNKEGKNELIGQGLQNVMHYLSFGSWEENWGDASLQLQTELKKILDYDERSVVRLVQDSFNHRGMLERMMLYLDSEVFLRILSIWAECTIIQQSEKRQAISLFAKEYPYLFLLLLEKICQGGGNIIGLIQLPEWDGLDYPHVTLSLHQTNILKNIMAQLPDVIRPKWSLEIWTYHSVDEKQAVGAVQDDSYQWLLNKNISVTDKRHRILELIRTTPSMLPDFAKTQQANSLIEIMDREFVLELIDILCELKETEGKTKCWVHACDWMLAYMNAHINNIESLPMNKLEGTSEQVLSGGVTLTSDYMAIGNAGLVLLTPWFPRLFSMLGLLNEEGKDFKDLESKKRAVFIMQRMVTLEEQDYTMMDLVFNRILVGLPLGEPLPGRMHLTNEEVETIDSMLEGVKGNWPQMNNTSTRGFQHSFIERKGVLEIQEKKILLTVEPCSYDLLLDSLPWGYKLVRFPWLEKRVHVSWRDKE